MAAISSSGVRSRCAAAASVCRSSVVGLDLSLMRWFSFRHADAHRLGGFGFAERRRSPAAAGMVGDQRKRRQRSTAISGPPGAASAQFGPQPMSARSGTSRSIACSIRSARAPRRPRRCASAHLEHQLVVDREQHVAVEVGMLAQRPVHLDHRELEHVARAALDRRVQRLAPPQVAQAGVRRLELGDVAAAAEQRLGVAVDRARSTCRRGTP